MNKFRFYNFYKLFNRNALFHFSLNMKHAKYIPTLNFD